MKLLPAIATLFIVTGLAHECLFDEGNNESWVFQEDSRLGLNCKIFNLMDISDEARTTIFKRPSKTYKKQSTSEVLNQIILDLEEPK